MAQPATLRNLQNETVEETIRFYSCARSRMSAECAESRAATRVLSLCTTA